MNLNNLDKALHELGMLSAITEARHDYLRKTNTNLGIMHFNTRFVSDVTVGYCMKKRTKENKFFPYVSPIRHRTKSENSDKISDFKESDYELKYSLFEPSASNSKDNVEPSASILRDDLDVKSPAKRCQSLENLNLSLYPPGKLEISPDMDYVSTRIQKLQVDEIQKLQVDEIQKNP